jgi:hypothetical protein
LNWRNSLLRTPQNDIFSTLGHSEWNELWVSQSVYYLEIMNPRFIIMESYKQIPLQGADKI